MTATRILRRPAQAEDRVALGRKRSAAPVATAPVKAANSASDSLQQSLVEHAKRIEQLEARLRDTQQDRDRLHAALDELHGRLSAAREAAQHEGQAEGVRLAQAHAQQELAARVGEWRGSIEQAARQFELSTQAIQAQLGEVVMTSVTKLLGDHAVNAPSVRAAIEQTLREAGVGAPVRVLIAPTHYEQLVRSGGSHVAALRERRIEIAPGHQVTAGGCMIETGHGLIDGRFDVQLQRLKDIVAGHYDRGSATP